MSGTTQVDLSSIVNAIQSGNQVLTQILASLRSGLLVDPVPTVYATVAGLPATAATGQFAFVANGRKPGEGVGTGTGVPIFFNGATGTWYSACSGTAVAA